MEPNGVNKYLEEEKLNEDTGGVKGNRKLKCPSCGLDNFVHADGICELDIPRKRKELSGDNWKSLQHDSSAKVRGLNIKSERDVEGLVDSLRR